MRSIKILGTGCPKCRQLAENVEAAAERLGVECEIEKVTEISQIMQFGVMVTPGLVVDGEVKACGTVLPVEQIEALLTEA